MYYKIMSEQEGIPQPESREKKWLELATTRPNIIVEIAAGELPMVSPMQNQFDESSPTEHPFSTYRYVAIDPRVNFDKFDKDYALAIRQPVESSSMVDNLAGKAEEVWINNPYSVMGKKDNWLPAAFKMLKPGGRVLIVDFNTPGLWQEEHERFNELSELGFEVNDLSHTYESLKMPQDAPPFVKLSLGRFNISKNPYPVVLELRKPE